MLVCVLSDTPWFFGSGSRQLKSRSPHSYLTAKKPMSPVWPKAHRFHTCLMFRLKVRGPSSLTLTV